jgi:alpha/beta superfamily hydrolase
MEPIRFRSGDGTSLEGELRPPESAARGSAVLCHAHPRLGGSKDHPILWAVRNELAGRAFVVLAFNFRGTMRSDGSYGGGHAEQHDVAGAITRVREEAGGPTLVCGWSFGASVALREALDDERVAALALIGLPLRRDLAVPDPPSPSELRTFRRPVLLLSGEHDDYCPAGDLDELARGFPDAETVVVPGTNHNLWRRERDAAAIVGAFAARVAEQGSAERPGPPRWMG